jgi:excinuclease UvrABC nuclease subunit
LLPTFPLKLGIYSLLDQNHAHIEDHMMEDVWLYSIILYRHDPKYIVNVHLKSTMYTKSYVHEEFPFDFVFRRVEDYNQVLFKIYCIHNAEEKDQIQTFQEERRK